MNTNQQNTQQGNQTTATQGGMMGNITGALGNAVTGVRSGSTNLVNSVSSMSTGKKLLMLAGLALGANMVRNRMKMKR